MIKKIKASLFEKLTLTFLILLGIFTLSFIIIINNKCLFVNDFTKPENIIVMNAECGNVIIELYPNVSPKAVNRFKNLIKSNSYDNVAFHRVIKDKLVQAGDLEFGKKNKLDYGKIGTGKSGLGTIKSEIDAQFDFKRGSVGLSRSLKYNTEDSQFFIILDDEPLFEGEYTPIGKVIYGIKVLEKIKYSHRSEYVLRPDFINTIRMYQ
jgi:peptidyl-prolyl cis-trans isomerase A (cyclophilin A)